MEIVGRQVEFGVATEATRGTPETTVDKWLRKVTANIIEKATHAIDDTTRGRLEDGEGRRVIQKHIEGDLEGVLHADAFGYFLSNIYGVVNTTTINGSVKQHVFTLKQNIQHESLTLFVKSGSVQQLAFSNAMINTFEITAAIDDYVRFKSSFLASTPSSNSSTPSYDTEYDFIPKDITLKLADSEAGLAGATAIKAKEFSIKWDQGLIRDHVVGSYNPSDIYNARLMIDGSFTVNFKDTTYKDLYLDDSSKYMSITIAGSVDIGSGNNPTIIILLNKVQIMDEGNSGGANDLITEPINFRAFFNPSDNKQSTVTLKNLTASYANVPSN